MWCAKQCLTRVFFSAQVSQEYSRHTSRFLCLDKTAEVEDMEVELLKGTERYWKLRCVLLSINSTNGVNRQCVPSSDSSIWNNPPDIKANDITVACNDLSVLGLRCQLRCCILFFTTQLCEDCICFDFALRPYRAWAFDACCCHCDSMGATIDWGRTVAGHVWNHCVCSVNIKIARPASYTSRRCACANWFWHSASESDDGELKQG